MGEQHWAALDDRLSCWPCFEQAGLDLNRPSWYLAQKVADGRTGYILALACFG